MVHSKTFQKAVPSLRFFFYLMSFLACTSCATKDRYATYVQRAYLNDQAKQALMSQPPTLEQKSPESKRVQMHNYYYDTWEKQPYESVDRWSQRLEETLELNFDLFQLGQEQLQGLKQKEEECFDQIHYFKKINHKISDILYQTSPSSVVATEEQQNFLQENTPFTLHLVATGETLYSISKRYYGTADRVKEIMLWNQGWIRQPKNLLAGLSLVLFFENSKVAKSASTVSSYIQTIQQDLQSE